MLFKQKYQEAFTFTYTSLHFTSHKEEQNLITPRRHVLIPCHKPPAGPTARTKRQAGTEFHYSRSYPPDASEPCSNVKSCCNLSRSAVCCVCSYFYLEEMATLSNMMSCGHVVE
jgi:hypothetical protein